MPMLALKIPIRSSSKNYGCRGSGPKDSERIHPGDVYGPCPGTGAEGNLAEREIADLTDRPISKNVNEGVYSDKKQRTCLSRIYFNATFKSSPLPRW